LLALRSMSSADYEDEAFEAEEAYAAEQFDDEEAPAPSLQPPWATSSTSAAIASTSASAAPVGRTLSSRGIWRSLAAPVGTPAAAATERGLLRLRSGEISLNGSQTAHSPSVATQAGGGSLQNMRGVSVQVPDDLGEPSTGAVDGQHANSAEAILRRLDCTTGGAHFARFLSAATLLMEACCEETRELALNSVAKQARRDVASLASAAPSFAEAIPPPPTLDAAAQAAAPSPQDGKQAPLSPLIAAWGMLCANRPAVAVAQSSLRPGDFAVAYGRRERVQGATHRASVDECSVIGVWTGPRVMPCSAKTPLQPPALTLVCTGSVSALIFSTYGDALVAGTLEGAVAAWALGEPHWLHASEITLGGTRAVFPSGLRFPSFTTHSRECTLDGADAGVGIVAVQMLQEDRGLDAPEQMLPQSPPEKQATMPSSPRGGSEPSFHALSPSALLASIRMGAGLSCLLPHSDSSRGAVGAKSGSIARLPTASASIASARGATNASLSPLLPIRPFRLGACNQAGRVSAWAALPCPLPSSAVTSSEPSRASETRISAHTPAEVCLELLADTAADPGRAPSGLLRLVALGSFPTPTPLSARTLGMSVVAWVPHPRDSACFFSAASSGAVVMGWRSTERMGAAPPVWSPPHTARSTPFASALACSPASPSLFAVGYSDGAVALFLVERRTHLALHVSLKQDAVVQLTWLRSRPAVLCALDAAGGLRVWDLAFPQPMRFAPLVHAQCGLLAPDERVVAAACAGGSTAAEAGQGVTILFLTSASRTLALALHPAFSLGGDASHIALANALKAL
jgi:hypothetical protein